MADAHREHALRALENTRATLLRVIARSAELRQIYPDRAAFFDGQILDGERELAVVEAEIAALERGGTLDDVSSAEDRAEWTDKALRSAADRLRPPATGFESDQG